MQGNDADQCASATKPDLTAVFLAGIILLLCSIGVLAAPEQKTMEKPQDPDVEEYPLSLGDKSSPRATLETFLSNTEAGWRKILQQGDLRWVLEPADQLPMAHCFPLASTGCDRCASD